MRSVDVGTLTSTLISPLTHCQDGMMAMAMVIDNGGGGNSGGKLWQGQMMARASDGG